MEGIFENAVEALKNELKGNGASLIPAISCKSELGQRIHKAINTLKQGNMTKEIFDLFTELIMRHRRELRGPKALELTNALNGLIRFL